MTRSRRLAAALTATAIGAAGCGGDEVVNATATTASEPILIKLDLDRANGRVLSGSHIGDSVFCAGGTTVSRYAGHTTVTKLGCHDGGLTIAFYSDRTSREQRACWQVVSATGRFDGLAGYGEVRAQSGRATFGGKVIVQSEELLT